MSNKIIATLKQGICSYNYGNYIEALAHFQMVAQNAIEPMMQDQAKKNIIKTYRKLDRTEEAIELCKTFLGHNAYHLWAVKTLGKMGVNIEENSFEEIDGELSAPLLPPELEHRKNQSTFADHLKGKIKQEWQATSFCKLLRFLNYFQA